jgi:hypothetical protein
MMSSFQIILKIKEPFRPELSGLIQGFLDLDIFPAVLHAQNHAVKRGIS